MITVFLLFFLPDDLVAQTQREIRMQKADSLYLAKNYSGAKLAYMDLHIDTSQDAMHLNRLGFSAFSTGDIQSAQSLLQKALKYAVAPPMKASIYSRLSRISAVGNSGKQATIYLDSAVANGYLSLKEIDTVAEYSNLRKDPDFSRVRDRLFNSHYPCMNDPRSKEFDFWVGDWEVYVTGTNNYAGHSVVQKIAGGCALLENWTSAVSEGKSLNFIDDSTKKWKQVWVGSYPNGKQDFFSGVYADSAMRFTFETTDAQGKKLAGRFTFFNQGPQQVRQFNETSADGGKTWTTGYDFTYRRIK